jgi:hypothetical protein
MFRPFTLMRPSSGQTQVTYDYCLLLRDTLNSMVDNTSISEEFTSFIIRESYTFNLEVIGYFVASVPRTTQLCIQGDIRPIFHSHLHRHLNSHTTAYSLLLLLLLLSPSDQTNVNNFSHIFDESLSINHFPR